MFKGWLSFLSDVLGLNIFVCIFAAALAVWLNAKSTMSLPEFLKLNSDKIGPLHVSPISNTKSNCWYEMVVSNPIGCTLGNDPVGSFASCFVGQEWFALDLSGQMTGAQETSAEHHLLHRAKARNVVGVDLSMVDLSYMLKPSREARASCCSLTVAFKILNLSSKAFRVDSTLFWKVDTQLINMAVNKHKRTYL